MAANQSYLSLLSYGDTGWGDELVWGAVVTLEVAVSAYALGIGLGLIGAAAKLSTGVRYVAADFYTTVVRSVPELLLIIYIYYRAPVAVTALVNLVGINGQVDIDPFLAAVVASGFIEGAYTTEIFRGAIQAVPKGQLEAARAFGMTRWLRSRRIILPQMLRFAIPGLGNIWLNTTKDASLVSVVSLSELMNAGKQAAGGTKYYFFIYGIVGAYYLVITILSQIAIARLDRWANRGVRRA
jgi:His/Glu/Gln/Arg/opine family amino acid ABC transporter permease subunit